MEAQDLACAQKKAQREGRLIVFIDESGLSERPTRVRTWAPKGQTPIIQFRFNWTHISVIAGLSRTNCLFRLHEGSIKKEQHVEFLKALRAHLQQPLLIKAQSRPRPDSRRQWFPTGWGNLDCRGWGKLKSP
jgi:hypothetical protein